MIYHDLSQYIPLFQIYLHFYVFSQCIPSLIYGLTPNLHFLVSNYKLVTFINDVPMLPTFLEDVPIIFKYFQIINTGNHGDSHAYAAQGARAHLDDHGAFQPGRLMAEKSLALSILRVQGAPLHRPDIP